MLIRRCDRCNEEIKEGDLFKIMLVKADYKSGIPETEATNKSDYDLCECCARKIINLDDEIKQSEKKTAKKEVKVYQNQDRKYCETCVYRGVTGTKKICNYLMIEKKRRPCEADQCIVYKRGKQMKEKVIYD